MKRKISDCVFSRFFQCELASSKFMIVAGDVFENNVEILEEIKNLVIFMYLIHIENDVEMLAKIKSLVIHISKYTLKMMWLLDIIFSIRYAGLP